MDHSLQDNYKPRYFQPTLATMLVAKAGLYLWESSNLQIEAENEYIPGDPQGCPNRVLDTEGKKNS